MEEVISELVLYFLNQNYKIISYEKDVLLEGNYQRKILITQDNTYLLDQDYEYVILVGGNTNKIVDSTLIISGKTVDEVMDNIEKYKSIDTKKKENASIRKNKRSKRSITNIIVTMFVITYFILSLNILPKSYFFIQDFSIIPFILSPFNIGTNIFSFLITMFVFFYFGTLLENGVGKINFAILFVLSSFFCGFFYVLTSNSPTSIGYMIMDPLIILYCIVLIKSNSDFEKKRGYTLLAFVLVIELLYSMGYDNYNLLISLSSYMSGVISYFIWIFFRKISEKIKDKK